MALIIPFNVSVTNTIIFFLLDIPALWAIQRGLLTLQAYYLHKRVRSGYTVPLARSRIPIVGGELLRGVTRWPSLFCVVNLTMLGFLCLATLGVDADEKPRWERASFHNITALSKPRNFNMSKAGDSLFTSLRENVTYSLYFRKSNFENTTCKTRNTTHADYWPIVFNGTQRWHKWFADNASCLANANATIPLLTTSCFLVDELEACSLDTTNSILRLRLRFVNVKSRRIRHLVWNFSSVEWNATLAMPSIYFPSQDERIMYLTGSKVIVFQYWQQITASFLLLLIKDRHSDSWFFALCRPRKTDDPDELLIFITLPLRLSPHGSSSVEYILFALRTNVDVALFMQGITMYHDHASMGTFELFESILRKIYRGTSLSNSQAGYIRKPDQDVTSVDLRATILYGIIIGLAFVLLPMKEVFESVLVHHGNMKEEDLLVYEYDQLSRYVRALTERLAGVPRSGGFALIPLPESANEEVTEEAAREGDDTDYRST